MECTFVVGQKVKCVSAFDNTYSNGVPVDFTVPEKGETYTIREVLSYPKGVGVLLVEIRNGPSMTPYGWVEMCFMHTGFRPLTDLLADFMAKRKQKAPKLETAPT